MNETTTRWFAVLWLSAPIVWSVVAYHVNGDLDSTFSEVVYKWGRDCPFVAAVSGAVLAGLLVHVYWRWL